MGTTSVRRNLFQHSLNRRAAPAAPSHIPAHDGSNGVHPFSHHTSRSTTDGSNFSSLGSGPVDNGEIVARDKNGAYKLDIPFFQPLLPSRDGEEMEGVERGAPSVGADSTRVDSTGEAEMNVRDKEKIEARLVELMCRNRNRQMSSEPAEILNLIQQSLRDKAAALDDDNWMYEAEHESRI
ncbi:hypothetical protein ASPZODRAFT_135750 [Penicilliopsis zonata CBS 506.65]|uniref:Uncharacterized protein n=1 Tax=Penicilliopsis zonata CBS 506.65 TaxID=1073090 RepID=A0A1L9S978_9EURO|nr:hypothetical protein ASPZODRAFT_135750 [Penicilliopsis zonata CBS 506.65]OJJ43732.1 hypothetical protein ASPZODRAFT_135750 [Penicilliopsis zonata CBS 506.65]